MEFDNNRPIYIQLLAKGAFYRSCDDLIGVAGELKMTKEKSLELLDKYWREV